MHRGAFVLIVLSKKSSDAENLQVITRHIDDVEALGDIGSINKDELAKALSRNRSLTAENAHLFYDTQNTKLTLYDVTSTSSVLRVQSSKTATNPTVSSRFNISRPMHPRLP